jgi:hypothetical protein
MVERWVKDVVAGNRQNKVGHTDMPHETDSDHEFWIMYNFMRPLSAKGAPVISMQQYADILSLSSISTRRSNADQEVK